MAPREHDLALGRALADRGLVDRAALARVWAGLRPGERLADALMAQGLVGADAVAACAPSAAEGATVVPAGRPALDESTVVDARREPAPPLGGPDDPTHRGAWIARPGSEPLVRPGSEDPTAGWSGDGAPPAGPGSEAPTWLAGRGPTRAEPTPSAGQARDRGLRPGATIGGRFRLEAELGRGGMGVVWLAERADGQHTRQVALKMPLVENLNWLLAARFARERNILASLEHPGIARLYDAGVDEEVQPYIAIEYVVGQAINAHVQAQRLRPDAIVALFIRVIDAVAHAHAHLVIHRDIKPGNILVDEKGQPHLLDFGIAKLLDDEDTDSVDATQLTRIAGRALTLDYASPEQVNAQALGTASDIYSLGVVLYELLTGVKPYRPDGGTRRDLERAILEQEPTRPSDRLRYFGGQPQCASSTRRSGHDCAEGVEEGAARSLRHGTSVRR